MRITVHQKFLSTLGSSNFLFQHSFLSSHTLSCPQPDATVADIFLRIKAKFDGRSAGGGRAIVNGAACGVSALAGFHPYRWSVWGLCPHRPQQGASPLHPGWRRTTGGKQTAAARGVTGQGPPRPLYPAARDKSLASRMATHGNRKPNILRQEG